MFRLIKLAAYALLGYVLYELFLGMTEEREAAARGGASRGQDQLQPQDSRTNQANRSMGGQGSMQVETEDSTGASARHNVGRGVIPS